MTDRASYIKGLRKLADILESHPEAPLPFNAGVQKDWGHVIFYLPDAESIASLRRKIGGKFDKLPPRGDGEYLVLNGKIEGLFVTLKVARDEVCTRRVVGTEEITEEVPDPQAPLVTVTRTKEIVEWDCAPVLISHE